MYHNKSGRNSISLDEFAVSAPPVGPVLLLLNDTNIIWSENHVGHQYTYM